MRAQFAFFRVATAHQHKARGVAHAQAFTLDQVFAGRSHVDEQIDQVVFEQVDLVDVQKAPVRLGQQSRRKRFDALRQGLLQVERTDHPVFGRAQGQVDHGHGAGDGFDFFAGFEAGAGLAAGVFVFGVAAISAALDHLDGGQQVGQCPDGG